MEVGKTTIEYQQNHRLKTDGSLSHWGGGGGLNAFYWRQISILDSVVVITQKLLSSHGGFLTNASSHRINRIKLTHYDGTKKRAHVSQIANAKESRAKNE